MKLCNTHSFFVPESPVYRAATTQWKGLDEKIFCGIVTSKNEVPEKPFAAHIDLSQFNIIEVNGKLMSVPSQQERDLTYKQYRKDRCEREGCTCYENFVESPPENSLEYELIYAKRLELFYQKLEVHHINENKNDMRPENLVTLCTNAHRSYSTHNNSGANRYDENGNKIK